MPAATGHIERTKQPIDEIFAGMKVDSEAVAIIGQALRELRDADEPDAPHVYAGGFLDGIIVGIRAGRYELAEVLWEILALTKAPNKLTKTAVRALVYGAVSTDA